MTTMGISLTLIDLRKLSSKVSRKFLTKHVMESNSFLGYLDPNDYHGSNLGQVLGFYFWITKHCNISVIYQLHLTLSNTDITNSLWVLSIFINHLNFEII